MLYPRFGSFVLAWFLLCPRGASSQNPDPHAAQPERPTIATHAGTVEGGWFEIETGGELDRYSAHSNGVVFPFTLKLGLASHLQLSLSGCGTRPQGANSVQIGDVALGVKWRLFDDLPILDKFAILPSLKLPTGASSTGAGTGTVDASMLLISSHELGAVELDVNVGFTQRSGSGMETPKTASFWTVSFGGPAVDSLGWVAELFSYPGTSGLAGKTSVIAILFGPTLTVRPWLVIDAGIIVPARGSQPLALYLGGVWNIGRIW